MFELARSEFQDRRKPLAAIEAAPASTQQDQAQPRASQAPAASQASAPSSKIPVIAPASKAQAIAVNKPTTPETVLDMPQQPSNADIMAIVTHLLRQVDIITQHIGVPQQQPPTDLVTTKPSKRSLSERSPSDHELQAKISRIHSDLDGATFSFFEEVEESGCIPPRESRTRGRKVEPSGWTLMSCKYW